MKKNFWCQLIHLLIILILSLTLSINPVSAKNVTPSNQSNTIEEISNSGVIWFVHDTASGANNGKSWIDAFTSFQNAIDIASSGDEIWVAAGTYWPSSLLDATDPRSATYQLKNGIAIYGGFVGTESTLEGRDWETNLTILSGDVDHNDSANPAVNTSQIVGDNAYHVVTGSSADNTAVMDGFLITAGKTKDEVSYVCAATCGGGMIVVSGNPSIRNITFIGNWARKGGGLGTQLSTLSLSHSTFISNWAGLGGGMYTLEGSPTINHTLFQNNPGGFGGGMYIDGSDPIISNVIFKGNTASNGGGLTTGDYSDPLIINSLFDSNTATNIGGAIENDYHGNLTLMNVTIINNTSVNTGGGIWNADQSNINLINVTITANSSASGGGVLNHMSGTITIKNSILWGNIPDQILDGFGSIHTATYSDIQGVTTNPGVGNMNQDPKLGSLGNYGGSVQVVPLLPSSPAINKVPKSQCLDNNGVFLAFDQRGVTRPQGGACDIGAFEVELISTFLPVTNR